MYLCGVRNVRYFLFFFFIHIDDKLNCKSRKHKYLLPCGTLVVFPINGCEHLPSYEYFEAVCDKRILLKNWISIFCHCLNNWSCIQLNRILPSKISTTNGWHGESHHSEHKWKCFFFSFRFWLKLKNGDSLRSGWFFFCHFDLYDPHTHKHALNRHKFWFRLFVWDAKWIQLNLQI